MRNKGYVVRAYNLLDLENSDGYNCIHDIAEDPELVPTIAEIIIKNTSNAKDRQNFWENAEKNLLSALLYYMGSACDDNGTLLPIEERSLGAIYRLLCNESFAQISRLIDKLPSGHPARAPFGLIHDIPVQNRSNVVLGLGNRLGVFQNKMVDCITKYNDIDITLPGQKPCCYYCIISDQDGSLEFLSSMFFSLLFWRLSKYARRYGDNGRLRQKVNICLEEFSNIGHLSDFLRIISVIRSRNIACQLVIQSIAQISDRYPGTQWEEIISNIDWQLFLGCNDMMTAEYISKQCGMVTIRTESNSRPQTPLFSPINSSTRVYRNQRQHAAAPYDAG
jgi:type IV secretion system protein VirD4